MQAKTTRVIQVILLIAFLVAGIRLGLLWRERHQGGPGLQTKAGRPAVDMGLSADAYVVPKRLHAYDLKSLAAGLEGKPVWIIEGYRYTIYPFAGGRADFAHEAGMLGPIEKVDVKQVREVPSPNSGQKQLVAVFDKDGKQMALPLGTVRGKDYRIYADEVLFYQDPHELYKHWSPEAWQAIEQHQVKPGMSEMQALFALGMGTPQAQQDSSVKTVTYPNNGKPVTITFRDGKAAQIDAKG